MVIICSVAFDNYTQYESAEFRECNDRSKHQKIMINNSIENVTNQNKHSNLLCPQSTAAVTTSF